MSSSWASDLEEARLLWNDSVEGYKGWGRPEQLMTCGLYASSVGLKHITCWLGEKTARYCIILSPCTAVSLCLWQLVFFPIVPYLYFFSDQPQFTYHLRNYSRSGRAKSIPVSEQKNCSSINFHQSTGKRCIIYFIIFWNDLLADSYFQLQIMTLSTEQSS